VRSSKHRPLPALVLAWVVLVTLSACGGEAAQPSPAPVAESAVTPAVLSPPSPEQPPATLIPPSSPTPQPTQAPTSPPAPTETPSPTPTSAPFMELEQAAYAASACSDKYPCNEDVAGWEARLRLPPGFEGVYFSHVGGNPTTLTFGPDGLLYVAMQSGEILIVDEEGEFELYVEGLDTPTGMAFLPGTSDLYVADRLANSSIEGESQVSVIRDGRFEQLFGGIPCCYVYMHAANGIAFGPDGYAYMGVGSRSDHGEILPGRPGAGEQDVLHPWEASILRFDPLGAETMVYAQGLRNAYDLAWDADGRLFATDNAPDYGPPDVLHLIVPGGQHGYPWYDCDGCFSAPDDVELVQPLYEFMPHAAAAGITVYIAGQFPGYYNNILVALWSAFEGAQKVKRFGPGGEPAGDFATGFAAPIDLEVGPDGSLYVADWATGIIFRISYMGQGDG
jgi:glucose/arabinose dehydrogenase